MFSTLHELWNQEYNMAFVFRKRGIMVIAITALLIAAWMMTSHYRSALHQSVYKIARDPLWYPLQLLGKEKNVLAFSNEIIFHIAREQGIQIELLESTPNNLREGLDRGSYDGILSALAPSIIYQDQYDFSNPFYLFGSVIVVLEKDKITSIDELSGRTIGIVLGASLSFDAGKFPSLLFRSYDNQIQAIGDLEKDIIDGVLLDLFSAYGYVTGPYAGKLRILLPPLTLNGLRLVTKHNERGQSLIHVFNDGLEVLKREGTYQKLLEKWGLPEQSG